MSPVSVLSVDVPYICTLCSALFFFIGSVYSAGLFVFMLLDLGLVFSYYFFFV